MEYTDSTFETEKNGGVNQTKDNNGDGDVIFDNVALTDTNTRYFRISEMPGSDDSIIYATNTQDITVTVADDGNGTLVPTKSPAQSEGYDAVFVNTKKGALKVTKSVTVDGQSTNTNLADGTYSFTITGPDNYNHTGSITVTNGVAASSIDLANLTPGEYTITENASTNGTTLSARSGGTNDGERSIKITVAAGSTADNNIAAFTNNINTTSLEVSKSIVSTVPADSTTKAFTFTVEVTKADGSKLTGTFGEYTFGTNGQTTVTTTGNETKTINGLPQGATYTVVESMDKDFENSSKTGDSGTLGSTKATAAFTNTRKTGSLKVTKSVYNATNNNAIQGSYTYPVVISVLIDGITYYVQNANGTLGTSEPETSLTVSNAADLEISNLPYGSYHVAETNPGNVGITGYSYITVDGQSVSEKDVDVSSNEGQVDLKNYYTDGASWQPTVKKYLNGQLYENDDYVFTFKLEELENAKNSDTHPDFAVKQPVNGIVTFNEIKYMPSDLSGQTGVFKYKITEIPGNDQNIKYDQTVVYAQVTVQKHGNTYTATGGYFKDENCTDPMTEVIFDNTELGNLTVTKTVSGSYTTKEDDIFPITVKKGDQFLNTAGELVDEDPELTVKAAQTITFEKIPLGTYVVTEGNADRTGYEVITTYTVGENNVTTAEAPVTKGNTTAVGIQNKYRDAELKVTKTIAGISDTTKLADAVSKISFSIEDVTESIEASDKTPVITATITAADLSAGKYVKTFTTAANGIKPDHTYKVTESVTAPEGYVLKSTTYEVSAGTADAGNVRTSTEGSLTLSNEDTSKGQIDFTNTYEEITSVKVKKTWNTDGAWPDGYTVEMTLKADGVIVQTTADGNGDVNPAILSNEKNEATWENLPKNKADGTGTITYTVEETKVLYNGTEVLKDMFTVIGNGSVVDGVAAFDNTPKTTTVSASKTWEGDSETETERPDNIEYTLTAKVGNATLTYTELGLANEEALKATGLKDGSPAYSAAWENLPKYTKAGEKIDYTVSEGTVDHYSLVNTRNVEGENTWTWEFTNKMVKVEVPGTKKMTGRALDGTDNDKYSFKIEPVTAGAPAFDQTTVNNDTSSGEFKFGPLYITIDNISSLINTAEDEDQVINLVYKVTENTTDPKENVKYDATEYTVTIPVTYNKTTGTISADNPVYKIGDASAEAIVFENTDVTRFDFEKVWKFGNLEQTWPEGVTSITVTLKREPKDGSGVSAETVQYTVTKESITGTGFTGSTAVFAGSETNYKYSITDLPKYWENDTDNSKGEWKYSISESQVDGYNLPIYFTAATVEGEETEYKSAADGNAIFVEAGAEGVRIENHKITVALPSTGGVGTTPYTIAGSLLMAFTALAYIFKKKRLTLAPVNDYDHSQRPNGRK